MFEDLYVSEHRRGRNNNAEKKYVDDQHSARYVYVLFWDG